MKRVGPALVCLLLTACGGGSSYGSAKDVADAFGCAYVADPSVPVKTLATSSGPNGWTATEGNTVGMQQGSCTLSGASYLILWSPHDGEMSRFVFDLGPPKKDPKSWLHAAGWVVHCPSVTACRAVQKKIGGSIG